VNGTQPIISGAADDGVGVGVNLVEVRVDGGAWQDAAGKNYWSASTTPGAGATMLVEARINDYLGYSSIISQTFVLDSTPPTTTLTIPAYVGGSNGITGTATDPAPANAQVETVEVQLDDENEGWQLATLNPANPDDSRDWLFNIFGSGDGITQTFRVRVTDYAGNVATTGWETAVVDTIAPDLTVTYHASEVYDTGTDLTLQGIVTDGLGVNRVTVVAYPDAGGPTQIDVTPVGSDQWSFILDMPMGDYTLFVESEDDAGNIVNLGPYAVTVSISPDYPCLVEATDDDAIDFGSTDASAVQDAVNAAASGDVIKIAGTCAGVQSQGGLTQTVTISQNLTLQGGYTHTNWLAASDPVAYPTVLDAQSGGRVVYIPTGGYDVNLTNLILTGGDAGAGYGGGVYVGDNGTVAVTGSAISGNTAYRGGGIYIDFGVTLTITGSTLSDNSAGNQGGGVFNDGGTVNITNSAFSGNSAAQDGGGVYNVESWLNITNSAFSGNSASRDGGGVHNDESVSNITNSAFSSNSATRDGGGVYNDDGVSNITNSTFSGNSAGHQGGGVHNRSFTPKVVPPGTVIC
jgi:hypothetical protein